MRNRDIDRADPLLSEGLWKLAGTGEDDLLVSNVTRIARMIEENQRRDDAPDYDANDLLDWVKAHLFYTYRVLLRKEALVNSPKFKLPAGQEHSVARYVLHAVANEKKDERVKKWGQRIPKQGVRDGVWIEVGTYFYPAGVPERSCRPFGDLPRRQQSQVAWQCRQLIPPFGQLPPQPVRKLAKIIAEVCAEYEVWLTGREIRELLWCARDLTSDDDFERRWGERG